MVDDALTTNKILIAVRYGSHGPDLSALSDPWEEAARSAKIELGLACYRENQASLDSVAYEAVHYVRNALEFADGRYAAHGDMPAGPYITEEVKRAFSKYADTVTFAVGTDARTDRTRVSNRPKPGSKI